MVDADFKEPDEGAAPSAKGGLVKILIYTLVVIAIWGGGFFAGKMLSGGRTSKDHTAREGEVKFDPVESGTKTGSAVDSRTTTETDHDAKTAVIRSQGFLPLESFTVNLNDPFGRRYLECVLNLVLNDKTLVPQIKENELVMAKIRHEIFMTISAKSYNQLKSTAGKITLFEEVQMRVNEILKEQMGVEPVMEVLQTKFLMQ
jgi:flagellar basal body-associated protein FliL